MSDQLNLKVKRSFVAETKNLVIGIEGGGTKTTLILTDTRNLGSQSIDSVTRVIRLGTRDSGAKCERLATSTFDSRMWLSTFDSSRTRVIYDVFF